jgi:Rps23 Pro-64 3,4-dihydroxylase Tpa1-like proline 4-hydroxylase
MSDKIIKKFDNLLDASFREFAYHFASNSFFKIGWHDGPSIENMKHQYLHSGYSEQDINNLGILNKVEGTEIEEILRGYSLKRSVMNLSMPSDVHWAHTHINQLVLLYYVNLNWSHDWAGETLFFSEDYKEVTNTFTYTPGRLLLFDGSIPHSIRPQSSNAPHYRFTLSMFFER